MREKFFISLLSHCYFLAQSSGKKWRLFTTFWPNHSEQLLQFFVLNTKTFFPLSTLCVVHFKNEWHMKERAKMRSRPHQESFTCLHIEGRKMFFSLHAFLISNIPSLAPHPLLLPSRMPSPFSFMIGKFEMNRSYNESETEFLVFCCCPLTKDEKRSNVLIQLTQLCYMLRAGANIHGSKFSTALEIQFLWHIHTKKWREEKQNYSINIILYPLRNMKYAHILILAQFCIDRERETWSCQSVRNTTTHTHWKFNLIFHFE